MTSARRKALIALGSNENSVWGDHAETLAKALDLLETHVGPCLKYSPFYNTPAFPAGVGPDFVNAVAMVQTDLAPSSVLLALHQIEAEAGRLRQKRWGQRTLDLDLIALDDVVLPDLATHAHWRNLAPEAQITTTPETLILPHPRVQDRAFVLVPLCDVAPHWRHPVLGLTAREMRDALPAELCAEVTVVSAET